MKRPTLIDWITLGVVLLLVALVMAIGPKLRADEPKVSIEIDIAARPGVTKVTTYPAMRTTTISGPSGSVDTVVRNYPAMGVTTIDVAPRPLFPPPPLEPRVEAEKDTKADAEEEDEE